MAWPAAAAAGHSAVTDGSPDLASDPAAIRVRKRPVAMNVVFASADGTTATREGVVQHAAGDAILTGVEGETWPIHRPVFLATYEAIAPTQPGEPGRYVKRPIEVLALELRAPASVAVGWQRDPLVGKPGDWLMQYGPNEHGIVACSIFAATYDRV